jgi:hypothetical protein
MALRFPYQLYPIPRPSVALGGRWVRPRPVVSVTVIGPSDTRAKDALLDTGSDDTLFPDKLAEKLGVDLSSAPTILGSGIGGQPVRVRYAQVHLRLTTPSEVREWPAWVGFTSATMTLPILGFAGCLQFFTSRFHGDTEVVELEVNGLYPGT